MASQFSLLIRIYMYFFIANSSTTSFFMLFFACLWVTNFITILIFMCLCIELFVRFFCYFWNCFELLFFTFCCLFLLYLLYPFDIIYIHELSISYEIVCTESASTIFISIYNHIQLAPFFNYGSDTAYRTQPTTTVTTHMTREQSSRKKIKMFNKILLFTLCIEFGFGEKNACNSTYIVVIY